MDTIRRIRDLFVHMDWADSMMWQSLTQSETAMTEDNMRVRAHHIHLVQRAFLNIWRGTPSKPGAGSELSIHELLPWAKQTHAEIGTYLDQLDPGLLDQSVSVPWAAMVEKRTGKPASPLSLEDSLYQACLHSTYHRAQVATKLKELGGSPQLTDYIIWIWSGRPSANWP